MEGLTTSSRVYPADMLEHPELMGEGVYAWLDKYCRADPFARLREAVIAAMDELVRRYNATRRR